MSMPMPIMLDNCVAYACLPAYTISGKYTHKYSYPPSPPIGSSLVQGNTKSTSTSSTRCTQVTEHGNKGKENATNNTDKMIVYLHFNTLPPWGATRAHITTCGHQVPKGMENLFTISIICKHEFPHNKEGIMFYTSIFLIAIIFFRIAGKWPDLMQQWQQVERALPPQASERERSWLSHRIKMVMLVAVTCSLAEHILSMLTIIYYVNRCPRFQNQPLNSFLFTNFSQFFYFFEYTTFAGICGKVINILSTFAWSFNDVFVMCLCVSMTAKFRQLNDYMAKYSKKPTTRSFWIERRKTYRMLCHLCEAVDDTIAVATLLCLTNNLYFICNKILKSLQKKPSIAHTLYFWYSLIFVIFRTFLFALFAAAVHDESKRPLVIFRNVKREYWCSESPRKSNFCYRNFSKYKVSFLWTRAAIINCHLLSGWKSQYGLET
ncbi:gustatory receptor for sugar taste 64e [Musca domestica]|uniref:Gustatory receptor for sugar taste 64e n=1 Tax=Musca domestica TaxID=7370 RepID=A0ABM3UV01_MUSDO|nr:gustatory receptor for sugar taste 64e [Musca domestica]